MVSTRSAKCFSAHTQVRDKTQSVCLLSRSTYWQYSQSFTYPILFRGAWFLIPNSPMSPSVVRIFIAPQMRLLSPDDALLH
ncbi:hypothetical protein HMPREF1991_02677 [Hoylesella loescheii DSM 19665 = JCM 12249 = ATCC 15930]|uniref:Uncharacterized protein n=1 Tax=Hoylesella loescheii DSM 19665 = JCM 12249 = ATCC 15930 TaxID=1122985 RepID=A0A069QEL9_HOYLO|nr:hypothetical protein HMPREF1991_02677 [Hoylesella loescheii DSM 19665 = JCM 12249 = ATCC 15930]